MFEIIYILLNGKNITAKDLASRFSVSTRTIYRDIDALSLAGIPVYTEKGRGGGISLLPDFVLNKSILSEREQHEILSALHGLSNVATEQTGQVLNKMSVIFNKTASNWLEVDFSDWSFGNSFFNDLKSAIIEHHVVEFDYFNSYGEKSLRRVKPVQLWFKSRAWYLKGFCLTKHATRLYKLSRIKNLTVTNERFFEHELHDISNNQTRDSAQQSEYVELKLRIEPEMTCRVFDEFEEDMVEKQPNGSFIVNVTWLDGNWVYGYILSFGEHIEVLEPEHIRHIIRDRSRKITERHR